MLPSDSMNNFNNFVINSMLWIKNNLFGSGSRYRDDVNVGPGKSLPEEEFLL
jgi:hypothetical protein